MGNRKSPTLSTYGALAFVGAALSCILQSGVICWSPQPGRR
jgi:hypothetical protein